LTSESVGAGFPASLSWSHYCALMRVRDPTGRAFYEIEAARGGWSVKALERQIGALLFERLAASRDPAGVLALGRVGQDPARPVDVLKDPVVLDFLDLDDRERWLENDLERAIMDRLQDFLLELGRGFCFVARQKRLTLDGEHFYVDLVFYNRLLRCFVLIDLKLGRLSPQDLGLMQMFVNYYDRFRRVDAEAPTIGIVLCSEKNDAIVRITLPESNTQVLTSRYQAYLPSEAELRQQVIHERERLERALGLAPGGPAAR